MQFLILKKIKALIEMKVNLLGEHFWVEATRICNRS